MDIELVERDVDSAFVEGCFDILLQFVVDGQIIGR